MASHELKTPLSSLKGMTQLLHRRLLRAGSSEVSNLVSMENSIRRMEVLVNDLLSISFIETGMFSLHSQRCNMSQLCRHLIEEYIVGTNPAPTIHITVSDETLEAEIDIERIGQVIINLLSNARKYSSVNSPIHVSVEKKDDACVIKVGDTGVGIAPELLSHIFERFYRAPGIEVQTGSSIGFGLGLYISRQIVERHGGRIAVTSTPGEGSTFSVTLPLSVNSTLDLLHVES